MRLDQRASNGQVRLSDRPEGILRILDLAYQMNPEGKGKRRKNTKEYVVRRIPRDCTPDTRESEETVRPA